MAAKPVNIRPILKDNMAKHLQQRRRQFGLRIQRVQTGTHHFARALAVAVQPLSVKILAFPAVIDRGQNFIGPVSAAGGTTDSTAERCRYPLF
jgi:hypothetical protein